MNDFKGQRGRPARGELFYCLRGAFTLIELMVVLAVIVILLSLLLPGLGKAREAGRRISCASSLKQLATVNASYMSDNGGWYPCYVASTGKYTAGWWCYLFTDAGYTKPGRGGSDTYDTNIHCPSRVPDGSTVDSWTDYIIQSTTVNYGGVVVYNTAANGGRGMRDSDIRDPSNLISFMESESKFIRNNLDQTLFMGLAPYPYHSANVNDILMSPWTHSNGGNYSWADGHVSYVKASELRFSMLNISKMYDYLAVDFSKK